MNKDEALKMAIKQLKALSDSFMPKQEWINTDLYTSTIDVMKTCKKALKDKQ